MQDKLKIIAIIALSVLLALSAIFSAFMFFQKEQIKKQGEEARVSAQNRIAELSRTIEETEGLWSRLAQEREADMDELRRSNEALANLIKERNEEITALTRAVATLRTVRVIDREPEQSEEEGRSRVDFSETYENFWLVHGYTLTNPAFAEINIEFARPANFTVVTTQQEDLSWRTYVTSDIPNLQIGEIDSQVNPISRPQEQIPWHHGIFLGVGGLVSVTGNSGAAYLEGGYDFGDFEASILGGGIAYPEGVDFSLGINLRLNPFAL